MLGQGRGEGWVWARARRWAVGLCRLSLFWLQVRLDCSALERLPDDSVPDLSMTLVNPIAVEAAVCSPMWA